MSCKKEITEIYDSFLKKYVFEQETLCEFSKQLTNTLKYKYLVNLLNEKPIQLFLDSVGKDTFLSKSVRLSGNSKYAALQFSDALALYNKSIALAPPGSIELALALGNRAACLLNQGYVAEALVDVERALQNTAIDDDYIDKLTKRRNVCFNRIIETKPELVLTKTPQFMTKSDYFESTCNKVVIGETPQLGRYLQSNNDVKTGELLVNEIPYASVLIASCYYSHCCLCLKRVAALVECTQCTIAMYCSTSCRIKHEQEHRMECKPFEMLSCYNLGKMDFLAIRIFIKSIYEGNNIHDIIDSTKDYDNTYKSSDIRRIFDLVANTEKRSAADLLKRTFTAYVIIEALDKFAGFFNVHNVSKSIAGGFILHLLQNLPCNAHEITEFDKNEVVEVGAGAYATLSLLNHSCDPNVVRQSIGTSAVLRAIKPIQAGCELVDNYGYHFATHTLDERQSPLFSQYYFTCKCEACIKNWPLYDELPVTTPYLKDNGSQLIEKSTKLASEFKEIMELVMKNKATPSSLEWLCEYLDFLHENFERPGQEYCRCQEAIKHALHSHPSFHRISL